MDLKLITERLGQLKEEFQSGQTMLAELETREAGLRQSLLRISGAIQVLEELLSKLTPAADADAEQANWANGTSRIQAR